MKVDINYPSTNSKRFLLSKTRRVALGVLIAGAITTGIVNLALGGAPWSLYVIGAEIVFWMVFLNWPLVENSFMYKVTEVCSVTALYIILCDYLLKGNLTTVVVPIIFFSLLIIQNLIYFIDFKNRRGSYMPMLWLIVASIVTAILALSGVFFINWQMITLGGVALLTLIISAIFYRKSIFTELVKRFHIN